MSNNRLTMASKAQRALDFYRQYEFYRKADEAVCDAFNKLGIRPEFYMIGGSVAMIACGINIDRMPHDVDVVVPQGKFYQLLISIIDQDSRFVQVKGSSSSGHYAFRMANSDVVIDVMPAKLFVSSKVKYNCTIQHLNAVRYVKSKWGRKKDLDDIKLIDKFFEDTLY